jgi:hypothetical protein
VLSLETAPARIGLEGRDGPDMGPFRGLRAMDRDMLKICVMHERCCCEEGEVGEVIGLGRTNAGTVAAEPFFSEVLELLEKVEVASVQFIGII